MKIKLASDIYTTNAIVDMAGQFSSYLHVAISSRDDIEIELTVVADGKVDQAEVINTFMNNILELSILERLNHEHQV